MILRPALSWLAVKPAGPGSLGRDLARARDPGGFARLRELCDGDPHVSAVRTAMRHRATLIPAAKGGTIADITVGDVLEILDAEPGTRPRFGEGAVFYRLLHPMGTFGAGAPATAGAPHPRPAHPRGSSAATTSPAGQSAACWWTTCGNDSPRWTTRP